MEEAQTGEVLLARRAHDRLPIASITKLMTVLVALERSKPGAMVSVDRDAVGVTGSTIRLRAGERLPLRDLVAAALIQSANDSAVALAEHVGGGDSGPFVEYMNQRAKALGLSETQFARPDGLDTPGHYSSASDVTRLALEAMKSPVVRRLVRQESASISGGRTLHTWNDLLGEFPGTFGVKTGHTSGAGWNQVAAARGNHVTIYATILGSPSRAVRNADLEELLAWGMSRYAYVPLASPDRVYGRIPVEWGFDPVPVVAARPMRRPVRIGRPLVERVVLPSRLDLPVREGQVVGEVRVYDRKRILGRTPLVAAEAQRRPGLLRPDRLVRRPHARSHRRLVLLIVTVTMNAALDRTVTVPNFQPGQRHRASAGLTLAGGKGVNIARALKRMDVPVVATGLAGGRTGARVVSELTREGILNDFVRIGEESRTSTAVVDPTGGTYTEINEWGPHVTPEELELLLEKLRYLSRGADMVVFAGTLPRGVDDGFYAEAIRELARRGIRAVLDAEGQPLRLGTEAEPFLVTPNEREAEGLVGQEFHDPQDFAQALDHISDLGARNVLITLTSGCYALLREEREVERFYAAVPEVATVSPAGSGDVLLAGYMAARLDELTARGGAAARGGSRSRSGAGGRRRPVRASRAHPARGGREDREARARSLGVVMETGGAPRGGRPSLRRLRDP